MNNATRRYFAHRHVISFEETNVVGNVYFARHVAWQGACREMFLKENAAGILSEIYRDLRLVTVSVSCDYFQELRAFDTIEVRMRLDRVVGNRITLDFDYRVEKDGGWLQCAKGLQEIGCMREAVDAEGRSEGLTPCAVPPELMAALKTFQ